MRPAHFLSNSMLRDELGKALKTKGRGGAPGKQASISAGDTGNQHRTNGGGVKAPKNVNRTPRVGGGPSIFGRGSSDREF